MTAAASEPGVPTFLRDLPLATRAHAFAGQAHRGQRRESDAAAFMIHPLEVAALLHTTGHRDRLVAAGILHDTVENSNATIRDIDQRKTALRRQVAEFGPDATAVYAADKVAKVRELRSRATRGEAVLDPRNELARDKLEHYLPA